MVHRGVGARGVRLVRRRGGHTASAAGADRLVPDRFACAAAAFGAGCSQSLDNDPPYYSTFGGTTYRYIADVYDPERLTRPEVTAGSSVEVTFSLYDFSSYSAPRQSECIFSNDTTVINRLVEGGLNPRYWVECDIHGVPIRDEFGQFVPLSRTLRIGAGELLGGLQEALVGCREQDEVELYMTYNQAYGEKLIVGLMTKQCPVAFLCRIDKVTK